MKRLMFLMPVLAWVICLPHNALAFIPGGDPNTPVAVPEPMTLLLLGSGIAGLVALRRKFK